MTPRWRDAPIGLCKPGLFPSAYEWLGGISVTASIRRQGFNDGIKSVSINGARPSPVTYLLDGASLNEPLFQFPSQVPPIEAIEEFKPQNAHYPAEFGAAERECCSRKIETSSMLTIQHIQEDLSKAYNLAVAARAGVNLSLGQLHDYGVDGSFHEVKIFQRVEAGKLVNRRLNSGFTLDFQCKSSIAWEDESDMIVYDL